LLQARSREHSELVCGLTSPGRMDGSQEEADVESFWVLEPVADGFRNYPKDN
jgi:catalase (peroxidase I)